ncbi:unknown [Clostridium sp. CAG:632]|nr:unknown [Clostridium sp. CAG:632]
MGREYDKAGLDYWVKRLNSGDSRRNVLNAFAGCPEFQNIIKKFKLN